MKKSSFKYWFLHWCAFQVTAHQLGVWKPRYLLHDWEKPWLNLFLPYEKVRKFHRKWSRHHKETRYSHLFSLDYNALVVDWECSRLTKPDETMDAYEYYMHIKDKKLCAYDELMILTTLVKLNLVKNREINF